MKSDIMSKPSIWGLLVVIASVYIEAIAASSTDGCPDDVMTASIACMPGHFSNGLISNMTEVKVDCKRGVFERSVTCLSRVASSCHGDVDKVNLLNSYTDIKRVRDTWNNMCSHANTLTEHHECWTETSRRSASCIKHRLGELQQRLLQAVMNRPKSPDDTVTSTSDAVSNLRLYCNTSRDILECFQPTLQQQCPSHVSGILTSLYLAFQPPICQVDTREETSTVRPCSGSAPFATAGGGEAMMMISTLVLWGVSFRFRS